MYACNWQTQSRPGIEGFESTLCRLPALETHLSKSASESSIHLCDYLRNLAAN